VGPDVTNGYTASRPVERLLSEWLLTRQVVASGRDRRPIAQPAFVNYRLLQLETTDEDSREKQRLKKELASVKREITKVPALPSVWIGRRVAADAKGPFHVFVGGNPQKKGNAVVSASLTRPTRCFTK
jgi:hypothetical protein